jgi:Glutaredoxin-like domain (DUF836)
MSAPGLPEILLYERSGCHLCEDARADLEALLAAWSAAGRPVPRLVGRDIDSDPAWHDAFFETIPVVEVGDRRLPLATSPVRVRRFIEEALAAEPLQGPAGAATSRMDATRP